MKKFNDKISSVRKMVEVQCDDGNWNYDEYMFGMANGMILCLSILEDREPLFFEKPDVWLADIPDPKINSIEAEAKK